jgi:hypothetical protein
MAAVATPIDNSRCARCGAAFHCGAADATPCVCSSLQLDPTTLATLRTRFAGCLCMACLRTLARTPHESPTAAPPP